MFALNQPARETKSVSHHSPGAPALRVCSLGLAFPIRCVSASCKEPKSPGMLGKLDNNLFGRWWLSPRKRRAPSCLRACLAVGSLSSSLNKPRRHLGHLVRQKALLGRSLAWPTSCLREEGVSVGNRRGIQVNKMSSSFPIRLGSSVCVCGGDAFLVAAAILSASAGTGGEGSREGLFVSG